MGSRYLYSKLVLGIFKDRINVTITLGDLSRIVHGTQHGREKGYGNQRLLLLFNGYPARFKLLIFRTYGSSDDPVGTV